MLAYLAFQLFAVGAASLAESERRAREELAGAKGRLEAMQERLAETTREAERLRIARELHDSLGHHLTALGLDLESAVRTVAAGGSLILPAVTERVLRGLEKEPTKFDSAEMPDRLTPREREVLRLIAGGFSNREIAEASGTAEGTVKNQTSSILSKLGVRDRTRAVLKALELGVL
ncbi:MAG: hypothetical protein JJE39_04775 [Vicinamibacteria bacterium]|nr:hypothetical protein [Vicinamibacteria bacterium]